MFLGRKDGSLGAMVAETTKLGRSAHTISRDSCSFVTLERAFLTNATQRTNTFNTNGAGNKNYFITPMYLSLNFPSFHIIYLPALGKKKCGKELHRIGRIGVLASKNLKANPCFGTARYDTGASRSASWSLRPPVAKAALLLN